MLFFLSVYLQILSEVRWKKRVGIINCGVVLQFRVPFGAVAIAGSSAFLFVVHVMLVVDTMFSFLVVWMMTRGKGPGRGSIVHTYNKSSVYTFSWYNTRHLCTTFSAYFLKG